MADQASPAELRDGSGAEAQQWSLWESLATYLLFSIPAIIQHTVRGSALGAARFDSLDWWTTGAVLAAAFGLTLAGRGLAAARGFLSVGLVTCLLWLASGWLLERQWLWATYLALALAVVAVRFHMVPVALFAAERRRRAALDEGERRALRRAAWGAVGAAAALDVTPLVYLFFPRDAYRELAAWMWLGGCVASGVVVAALAARRFSESPGGRGPAGSGNRAGREYDSAGADAPHDRSAS
jgi:hypothetical protein